MKEIDLAKDGLVSLRPKLGLVKFTLKFSILDSRIEMSTFVTEKKT